MVEADNKKRADKFSQRNPSNVKKIALAKKIRKDKLNIKITKETIKRTPYNSNSPISK